MKLLRCSAFLINILVQTALVAQVQLPGIGFFNYLNDIGTPGIPGTVQYDEPGQGYLLTGSGSNMWLGEDSFSFLWKEMQGDFILQCRMSFLGKGADPHRKAGLMIRDGLSANAAHISCVVHGDGLTSFQFRRASGEKTGEMKIDIAGPDILQLEKKGTVFTMSVAHFGSMYQKEIIELDIGDKLLAGLFICSHNDTVVEKARFSNVRVFGTAPEELNPYGRNYIGSLLEIMDVETGHRQVLSGSDGSWQAPNWTPDGESLIFNADGLLYKFNLATGIPEVLPTGFATSNNNDHVISFNGKQLAISHQAEEDNGRSIIYTLPVDGGEPVRITPEGPSYLHGWSADDRFLVYTARRGEAFDIYRIPAKGGDEEKLTDFPTLDDGPEYSPDGKYIYFNSSRTGTMQIWRMDPDGSNQTQLTFDDYNDWFAHISPDNKWMVFISYPPHVPAGSHPFYKRVYLRLMSVEKLKPRVIGYLYGGQGTMNVPSWSPDSKKIAFVSNGKIE